MPDRRAVGRALAAMTCCASLLIGAVQAADVPRFRSQPDAVTPALSTHLLTPTEQAYVASLPIVRVAVPDPPAEPYEFIGPDGVISGIHPEMLVTLGKAFGIRMQPVVVHGWPAVLQAARQHEVDVVMTVGVTAERLEYLAFTLGATPWPGALFTRRGSAPADLSTARFALEREYLANDFVRRRYPRATIIEAETTTDALRAVADGRADCYLGSLLETTASLARRPVPGVEAERLLDYGTGHYHFGVRKDWAPLAAILNKGIQVLRSGQNAELDAALSAVPPAMRPPPPLALDAQQSAVLVRRPVWRIGAVRGLAMLNDVDPHGAHSGVAAEYTEQVVRKLGVGAIVVPFDNVAAMLDGLRTGGIDLVPFLTRTPKREKEFVYSQPYVEMPYMLVARSDGPLYWSLGSLEGRRLALAQEHPLREVLAARHPKVQVVDAANGNAAMDLVAQGQADAAVEVKLFANLRINGDNDGTLRTTTTIDELPAEFAFAASSQSAELIPLVNRALADIPAAEKQRMLRRWVAVDLRPAFPWRRYVPLLGVVAAALIGLAGVTWWWMRRLRREVKVRRRSEELLNDIATTVPGVAFRYVIDADGTLRHHYFSPGARAFLGCDLHGERTVMSCLAPFIPAGERDAALALEQHCLKTGERMKLTTAYEPPQSPPRWLHAEAVRTRVSESRTIWTGYIVDVTAEQELQARLIREADARNLLLATASHELRAPTNNLSLALQSIRVDELDPQSAAAVRIARKSSQTLAHLLNDVLDAAKFDSGAMRLSPRAFDLREMLDELNEIWHMAAEERGLEFTMEIGADVPRSVTLDPLRLKQVMTNLLSNACKFTLHGRVSLRVARDDGGLSFVVQDTGIGISAEAQKRLFQPFVTIDEREGQGPSQPSTGLGMLVSRKLAELMGGRLELRSERGAGTQVSLHVPLPSEAHAGEAQGAKPGQVVICDDDDTTRMLMSHMLRTRGYEVSEAGDAAEALAAFRRGDVNALITDLTLPGMSGQELIHAIRDAEGEHASRTPVIVCSGSPASDQPYTVLERNLYDAYLLKPVQIEALVGALERLGVHGPALAA